MAAQQRREMTLCSFCREPFKTLLTFTGCKHRICRSCTSWLHADAAGQCPWCFLLRPAGKDGKDKGRVDGEGVGSRPAEPPEKCQEHQEALEMFCVEDRSPVCRRCAESQAHRAHAAVPLEEAADEYKTKLKAAVKLLQQQKVEVQSVKSQEEEKLDEWKNKTSRESEKIEKEFEKLHDFLDEEEEKLQRALKREKKGTATKLCRNIAQMTKQSQALGELIDEIHKRCQQPALGLLKEVESLLSRSTNIQAWKPAAVPAELQGAYDVPTGGIFEFLNRFKVDVTLDPASAHPSLLLSEDGRSVSHGGVRQDLPDHPERFDPYVFVLGSLRITSGRCYWEVEVGDKTEWDIGVCREAVKRKGKGPLSPPAGFWRMWLRNGNQYKVLLSHPITLSLRAKLRRVGIYLDYKGGEVTFYNAADQTHIYTYSGAFAGVLRPFFSPGLSQGGNNAEPLVVCPAAEQE
ncbi:E3 ubiquitin-protein ligase TRIM58-like [Ciconia maguari]